MIKNRFFYVIVVAALGLMVALTFHGAIETDKVARAAGESNPDSPAPVCDIPAVERSSIRRVYVEQMDSWVTFTDGGPTGVDGGLIDLLSNARVCSK